MYKIARIFLALVTLLAGLPLSARAQTGTPCAQDAIVQAGDTLSIVASRYLGDPGAYAAIVQATNERAGVDGSYATITDPNVISVGWKLCIPPSAAGESAADPADARAGGGSAPGATSSNSSLIDAIEADLVGELDMAGIRALSITAMRQRTYPGSAITIEQPLSPGSNYSRAIASYQSDGLKIYALLTVPAGTPPATGWPVILFNHGYIPPALYSPTERYEAYVDALARSGYIVLRPDYRGHGNSEGDASGAYGSPAYTVDVLNAVASVRQFAPADPERIGMWGHSLGGYIALRTMVIDDGIRAGVIWAGVVASYADMLTLLDIAQVLLPERAQGWRNQLIDEFGTPAQNPQFWRSISANSYLDELSGPLQLHHGTADPVVPTLFSLLLHQQLRSAQQPGEYYTYLGDDHNISASFPLAMERTLAFFDEHVKNADNDTVAAIR